MRNPNASSPFKNPSRARWNIKSGLTGSVFLLGLSLLLGVFSNGWVKTIPLAASSIVFEVVVGATASVPLGFHPVVGAWVASLANLAPVPVLLAGLDIITRKWGWLQRRLAKADKLSQRYGKYGVWILVPLAPIVGVYVGVAVGTLLRFRPTLLFASLSVGVVVTSLVITLGGAGISNLWHA